MYLYLQYSKAWLVCIGITSLQTKKNQNEHKPDLSFPLERALATL